MKSKHPYEPFLPQAATKLIIGTMPPPRFCVEPQELLDGDVNFYYGSRDNYFWDLLAETTGAQLERNNSEDAVKQRKDLLTRLNIGITDIIKECIHKDGKADDASLKEITHKPIKELLLQNPKIDTLIYTSAFVIKLVNQIADKSYHSWEIPLKVGSVIINGKKYNVIVLYSPSPMALRSVDAETRLNQYRNVFGELICVLPLRAELS